MRLGEMLVAAGVVTPDQLHAALADQQRFGGRLGQLMVRRGFLKEDMLVMALCRQLALPKAELDSITAIPDAIKQRIDQATCEKYHVLPLAYVSERKAIQLAMSDPFDVVALDDLTRMFGVKIEAFLAGDQALGNAIRRLYTSASSLSIGAASGDLDLTDNTGNVVIQQQQPSSLPTRNPTASLPRTRSGTPSAQLAQAAQASFQARLDEHRRALRAVADLLAERGYVPRI